MKLRGLGACRTWGVEAKFGPSEDSFCRVCRPIAEAMGQKAEPNLRAIVVGHTNAHVKHGGDGAFYVQLRNREKFRG